ncbi:MAG TPA: BamA/TamA family outer membrane protein, partial [Bacteroidales bacterium]|nr:BamA/TamA family outer membrane protein [Bacteroidales bacterium]
MSTDTLLVVRDITISGNKVTKDHIILRELPFASGDTLMASVLPEVTARSEDNLMNTSLFNFVTVTSHRADPFLDIQINVTERWYIWPIPIFEHAERNFPAWLRDPEFSRLNYGLQVNWNNFRGRRELIELKVRLGYKEQYGLMYAIPNLGRRQQHGISFGVNKFRQHEVIIKTANNEPRYLSNSDKYTYETLTPSISYTWRPGLYFSHSVFFSYSDITFRNNQYHEEYLGVPPGTDLRWFSLSYLAEIDYRDYKFYPLKGYLLLLRLHQQGLGLVKDFNNSKTYLTFIGAVHNKLLPRFYLGDVVKVRLTKDEVLPYYFRQGIGYNTYLRGFEYYLIDG